MKFSLSGGVRALFACCTIAATAACTSMVGFGYQHADRIAAWKADQYFDLNNAQKDDFHDRFARFHAWHRYGELPDYASFLTSARQRIERGVTASDIDWFVEGLRTRYRRMVRHAAPDAADMLATLTATQIDTLEKQWQKDNRKFAHEHRLDGIPEERLRARARRTLAQIKDWTGSLSDAQEARVRALLKDIPDTERARYEDRLRRQREFFKLLEARGSDRRQFTARLAQWLTDWETGRDPEYQRVTEVAWQKRIQLYLALEHMLTPEQRSTLVHRLQDHIDEFHRLTQSGAPGPQAAGSGG